MKPSYIFKYSQTDFGEVCTLINIINVFDYMNDQEYVKKLLPYLNEETWQEFLEEKVKNRGYTMKAVSQLIYQKCRYRVQKFTITDARSLMNVPTIFMVAASGTHCIAFYKQMIFDALYEKTQKSTMKNIQYYPRLGNKKKNPKKKDSLFTKANKSPEIYAIVYKLIPNIRKTKSGQMKATL